MKLIKTVLGLGVLSSAVLLSACGHKIEPKNVVRVGTMAGPETVLMDVAKQNAKKRFGLDVKITTFTSYSMPNAALSAGDLDANAFQDLPFLKAQDKTFGYHIVSIGKTFIYPMGLYSQKYHHLAKLPKGAEIAIPNDPSNEARALLLLQKAHLLKLKKNVGVGATVLSVLKNPKHFKLVPIGDAQLPRVLPDVALAAINTTYAIPAGLSPTKDALFHEGTDSPYANIIAARAVDAHNEKLKELVAAFQSTAVLRKARKLFGDGAIKAWH